MKFNRVLSAGILPGQSVSQLIQWKLVDCSILNADGSVRFEQPNVEVPEPWSQHAANILAQKYFRKAGVPNQAAPVFEEGSNLPTWLMRHRLIASSGDLPVKTGGETSARQVFHRLAGCWTYHGWKHGYFSSEEDARVFYDECYLALARQLGAPNSPQWFNCFSGSERFITKEYGSVTFEDVVGESVTVLTSNGWSPATVKIFGKQRLQQVMMVPVYRSGGNYRPGWSYGKTNFRVSVDVTKDHRWILENGSDTTDLSIGDILCASVARPDRECSRYRDGFQHGVIFGDGNFVRKFKRRNLTRFRVRLCGNKVRLAWAFDRVGYPPCFNGDALAQAVSHLNLKDFPDAVEGSDYIAGFLDGWIATDGTQKSAGFALTTIREDAEGWLRDNAALGGWLLGGASSERWVEREGSYDNHSTEFCYGFRLTRNQRAWKVISIAELDNEEEVYCAVVPEVGNFTLASGVLTGNCGLHWAYGIEGPASGQWAVDYEKERQSIIMVPGKGDEDRVCGVEELVYQTTNSYEHPQPHACFIQHVSDDLVNEGGIFDLLTKEARLFKHGSGTGSNFSTLRGKDEHLSGGGRASGMMSFLEVLDRGAGAIKSGGVTRRAAKMVICDMDHPEIEQFIDWKVREESKAAAMYVGSQVIKNYELAGGSVVDPTVMIPDAIKARIWGGFEAEVYGVGWEEEARESVSGQNSNNSVRITNDFLRKVDQDEPWDLWPRLAKEVGVGTPTKTLPSRELWLKLCRAAWACGDPGVQFHNTINEWHTCPIDGPIRASNPCSEFLFLDSNACNLASLNLARFMREDSSIDVDLYEHAVRLFTVVLDISVQMASFPSREIAVGTYKYRTLGLGLANVGGLLMRSGLPYDSDEGRALAAGLMSLMTAVAYRTSAELADELGAFPRWGVNEAPMRRVLHNHRESILGNVGDFKDLTIWPYDAIPRGINLSDTVHRVVDAAGHAWNQVCNSSSSFRNAQVTVCAPTGTISYVMDCDTNGVEPEFALVKYKHLAGGGMQKLVNPAVPEALRRCGVNQYSIERALKKIERDGTLEGDILFEYEDSALGAWESLPVFDCSNPARPGGRFLRPMAHVLMVAALQPHVSGGISKTVNLPNSATIEDFDKVMREAHRLGVKCVALFRDGCKLSQPLNVLKERLDEIAAIPDDEIDTSDIPEATEADFARARLRPRPGIGATVRELLADQQDRLRRRFPGVIVTPVAEKEQLDRLSSALNSPQPLRIQVLDDGMKRGEREFLPWRRESGYRQKAKIGEHGQSIYWSVSNYPDGRPGEIFITLSHEGSTLRAMAECLAIAMSDALQHGTPLESLVDKYLYTKFEPSGLVEGHDRIKFATSIADLIARDLAITYLGRDDVADVRREQVIGDDKMVALDRRALAVTDGSALTGNECPRCGGMLVRDGSCVSCTNCDYNEGCGG